MSQRLVRIRLLASKECVASAACISPEARATQEAMQAAAIIHAIREMKELITADDREQLVELAKEIGFSADIFMSILNAFADLKVKGKRRQGQLHHHHHRHHHQHCHHHHPHPFHHHSHCHDKGQKYHPQVLNFFVQDDWTKMTAEDATAYTVLEVIIQRAYILGGINMSEHSTKFLTSLMLEVTGARSMLVSERKKWHSYLKAELKNLFAIGSLWSTLLSSPRRRTSCRRSTPNSTRLPTQTVTCQSRCHLRFTPM